MPVDILVRDVVDNSAKDIGSGYFEEIVPDKIARSFINSGRVYGRSMQVFENFTPEWSPSSEPHPVVMFRDDKGKLRLFVNTFDQHLGIQPGMGLPEFAGTIKSDDASGSSFTIANDSGHYKPESTVDEVKRLFNELAPDVPINFVFQNFPSSPRVNNIGSPEEYVDSVSYTHLTLPTIYSV